MIEIQEPQSSNSPAWLNLGFRPFFIGAALFAVLSMSIWAAIFPLQILSPLNKLAPTVWHAHEMIYGYAMAVIAGFLLAAVKNWTGLQTPRGALLFLLFFLWLAARLLPFAGLFSEEGLPLQWTAFADLLFMAMLIPAVAVPIIRVKSQRNLVVIAILALLLTGNGLFYLGVFGILTDGIRLGLYLGFYIIIALVLMMGRRVIPFFTERGVGYSVTLTNYAWLDKAVPLLMIAFIAAELVTPGNLMTTLVAAVLMFLLGLRLVGWHTKGIWRKPLLWVLHVAYGLVVLGFALKVAAFLFGASPFLAVHAFAMGGIGLMTLGMMARVCLGHTGRNVFAPPAAVNWMFLLLSGAVLLRVFVPLLAPAYYGLWVGLSQLTWILAFALFSLIYIPMLVTPRVDGQPG
ncbi:NnrS family protein [uncultured Porticoccus sp.]|uniref:NnrS family protein n=1 Tax=uncultured Porticoccus sp. TaxID=1256050 RepID=UPI0030DD6D3A|tara:strand:- start:37563 stop:38771 length:1209 start_codon:yes stop_codon:yes gene_type:complete